MTRTAVSSRTAVSTRTAVSSRSAVTARDTPHPQTYNVTVYGDSYSNSGGGSGWIGQTLNRGTSEVFVYREMANGGDLTSEIRTVLEADFPHAGGNLVIINGTKNSLSTDVDIETIKSDWTAMIDLVQADGRYQLVIVNQSPYMGNTFWNQSRQDATERLNAWMLATYPDIAVDIYTPLGDPEEPRQLADEFYKASRTDGHPSRNADVVIDDLISEKLFYRTPTITRDADVANVHPFPNIITSWSTILRASIGGNSIQLCDGTYSSSHGLISSTDTGSHPTRHQWVTGLANETSIIVKALVKPGDKQWISLDYRDKANTSHTKYFDLINLVVGPLGAGTMTPAITKAARGWIEISLTGTNGTGVTNNWIQLAPADGDNDANFTGDGRTPSVYIDRVQLVLA